MAKQRLRKYLLRQSGGKCRYCGEKLYWKRRGRRKKVSIDHYVPKFHGGTDARTNLVASCADCNNKKGHLMPEEFQTA